MTINSSELIDDLCARTDAVIRRTEIFKHLDEAALNRRPAPQSWSVLECLEHLNLYGDFYLKAIEHGLLHAPARSSPVFKSGLIGNYFAELMLPRNGAVKKMKTFRDKDPRHAALGITTVDRFLKQQAHLLALLERARKADLNRIKTPISITRLLKLKLGDTFRVVIYHNQRHVLQAEKALSGVNE